MELEAVKRGMLELHVFTEENTLLSSYSDASMPPTKIDIPQRTEPDEVEPAEAAVAPTNSSCQGPVTYQLPQHTVMQTITVTCCGS